MLLTGLTVSTAAMAWFALIPMTGAYATSMLIPMTFLGVGLGVAFPPLMVFAMSGTTPEDAGAASGVLNTSAEVGASLGLAVLASVSAAFGFQVTFVISTIAIGVSTIVGATSLRLTEKEIGAVTAPIS